MDENLNNFFTSAKQLLLAKAEKSPEESVTPGQEDGSSDEEIAAYAIESVFGIAVLSGNFDLIIKALEAINAFEKAAKKEFCDTVYEKCGDQIKRYLG